MEERWKLSREFAGIIEVSDHGNIWRIARSVQKGGKIIPSGPHHQWINRAGYKVASVMIDGARKKIFVHRLVAWEFVDGFHDGLTVNHINGIKTDNRAVNLEWITKAENTRLQWKAGLVDLRGEKHPLAKLTNAQADYARNSSKSAKELGYELGVSHWLIYKIKDGTKRPIVQGSPPVAGSG